MKGFYNTVPLTGEMLIKFQEKAFKQQEIVLSFFQKHPERSFTPIEVHYHLWKAKYTYPLTSVRRAITNLTSEGKLVMVGRKMEQYGSPNNTWKAA